MQLRKSYQLTDYAVGSIREVWTLSWPLMIGLFSTSFQIFVDRFILSTISAASMNAIANAALVFWGLSIMFIIIAETTEFFVGKYHGAEKLKEVGRPVWQMVWFALMASPALIGITSLVAPYIFAGTGNSQNEIPYLTTIICFVPFFIMQFALNGFFVGTGRTKILTYVMLFGNLINGPFCYFFAIVMNMGCQGAALGTGLAWICQWAVSFLLFSKKEYRLKYGTLSWKLDFSLLKEFLRIAVPSGVAKFGECLAHIAFYAIMARSGFENMTIVVLVQMILILMSFIAEGLAKGVGAVVSNLVGAKKYLLIPKAIFSAFLLHVLLTFTVTILTFGFTDQFVRVFIAQSDLALLSSAFFSILTRCLVWLTLFFLLDGFCWVLFSFFLSIGDSKFVMWVNIAVHWVVYVAPVYYLVNILRLGADMAWMTLALCNVVIFTAYLTRYFMKMRQLTTQESALESIPAA